MKLFVNYYLFALTVIGLSITSGCATTTSGTSPFDAVVACDGSGDFASVQAAVEAAPDSLTSPWLIFVKNGSYEEQVVIPEEKPYIHLIGQNKERTVIHLKLNVGGRPENPDEDFWKYSIHNSQSPLYEKESAVVTVKAPHFYSENISFINDYGVEAQSGPQALAMKSQADCAAFNNCIFRSYQDTWMTSIKDSDRLYVRNCWIEGAVDYLYGGGDVLVENSTFYNVRSGSVIVAPCHSNAKYGYVIRDCVVDGNNIASDGKVALGRPWHNSPKALFINTVMRIPISPEGWTDMGTAPDIFAEYGSCDVNGNELDLSKRKKEYTYIRNGEKTTGISRTSIAENEASVLTYENIFPDSEEWNPKLIMTRLPSPSNVRINGDNLKWEAVPDARGYIIIVGENVVGFSIENQFKLNGNTYENVRVRAVNAFGSLGMSS